MKKETKDRIELTNLFDAGDAPDKVEGQNRHCDQESLVVRLNYQQMYVIKDVISWLMGRKYWEEVEIKPVEKVQKGSSDDHEEGNVQE